MPAQKVLVETTGSFGLISPSGDLPYNRPSVHEMSQFINSRVGLGQVKVLGALIPEATDTEFLLFVRESTTAADPRKKGSRKTIDMALAVEAFLAKYGQPKLTAKGDEPAAE